MAISLNNSLKGEHFLELKQEIYIDIKEYALITYLFKKKKSNCMAILSLHFSSNK